MVDHSCHFYGAADNRGRPVGCHAGDRLGCPDPACVRDVALYQAFARLHAPCPMLPNHQSLSTPPGPACSSCGLALGHHVEPKPPPMPEQFRDGPAVVLLAPGIPPDVAPGEDPNPEWLRDALARQDADPGTAAALRADLVMVKLDDGRWKATHAKLGADEFVDIDGDRARAACLAALHELVYVATDDGTARWVEFCITLKTRVLALSGGNGSGGEADAGMDGCTAITFHEGELRRMKRYQVVGGGVMGVGATPAEARRRAKANFLHGLADKIESGAIGYSVLRRISLVFPNFDP